MKSLVLVATYVQWILAVAIGVVFLRILYTLISMSNSQDESISLSTIVVKVGKQVKALIIMVCVEGIISFIKGYFFHN